MVVIPGLTIAARVAGDRGYIPHWCLGRLLRVVESRLTLIEDIEFCRSGLSSCAHTVGSVESGLS